MEAFVTLVVNLFLFYLLLGLLFALVFAWKGAGAIDAKAIQASWFFKLLILPGAMALWPLLLTKWIAKSKRS
ncbi:MAG: hypothetical protein H6573_10020 [Lewinellaceae bacterium]|nr:hypothetical protein [Phaeodactylibacter sp.]MCB9347831.1 hypothetical protein [Lewinellaceae bacterium]